MATSLKNFFTNSGSTQVVQAPAFSLTKVMAVVAPLVTVVTTAAINALKNNKFTTGQWTELIVALIAFLAITSAADVLARGIATSAQSRADSLTSAATSFAGGLTGAATRASEALTASAAGRLRMMAFKPTLAAQLAKSGPDESVKVIAMSDALPPEFLCHHADESLTWEQMAEVRFTGS